VSDGRMIEIVDESTNSVRISMSQAGDGVIGKGTGGVAKGTSKFTYNNLPKNPKELLEDGWKDITPDGMRKNTNSREYEDPRTGIRVRFDPGNPSAPGV
jgi:hypothetical protein